MRLNLLPPALLVMLHAGSLWGQQVQADPRLPALLKGTLAAKQEATWEVVIQAGSKARILAGGNKRGLIVDGYDPQGITPNEGADDDAWFPVDPGTYKITLTNATHIGSKAKARPVAYEIKVVIQ